MGGVGSGRLPSAESILRKEKEQFIETRGNVSTIELPNLSGVQNAARKSGTSMTAGSVVFIDAAGQLAQDNTNLFWDDTNNRLGIGTASPNRALHILAGTGATIDTSSASDEFIIGGKIQSASRGTNNGRGIAIGNTNTTSTATSALQFNFDKTTGGAHQAGSIQVGVEQQWTGAAGTRDAYMAFHTGLNSDDTEKMRITSAGDVGIGTTVPGSKLDVNGSFQCNSITNNTGLAGGKYQPTLVDKSNLDADPTFSDAQYIRVGNTVNVSGRITGVDPTVTATQTFIIFTLPLGTVTSIEHAAGTAFCATIAGMGAAINADVGNGAANMEWIATDITSQDWSYNFTYQIIP